MPNFRIELEGFDELQAKLGKVIDPYIQALTMGIGEELRASIARYPGPSNRPVIWGSEKSRRWWFASRRAAGLPAKYTRGSDPWSERLGASWAVAKSGSMDAIVGSKATGYAARVQSDERQTAQHRATGWITDKLAVAQVIASGIIARIWKDTVDNIFERR